MTREEKNCLQRIDQEKERRAHVRKFALTLLEQCKGENLTLIEFEIVLDVMNTRVKTTTLRDGLILR